MKSILSANNKILKNISKMKKKHIFSVNVIRDKMNLKPPYNKLNDFLKTRKSNILSKPDLACLKSVVTANYETLISDIDKAVKESK